MGNTHRVRTSKRSVSPRQAHNDTLYKEEAQLSNYIIQQVINLQPPGFAIFLSHPRHMLRGPASEPRTNLPLTANLVFATKPNKHLDPQVRSPIATKRIPVVNAKIPYQRLPDRIRLHQSSISQTPSDVQRKQVHPRNPTKILHNKNPPPRPVPSGLCSHPCLNDIIAHAHPSGSATAVTRCSPHTSTRNYRSVIWSIITHALNVLQTMIICARRRTTYHEPHCEMPRRTAPTKLM